jgi:hypothetical protein
MPMLPLQPLRGRTQVLIRVTLVAAGAIALLGAFGASSASAARSVTFTPAFSLDSHLGEGTTLTTELTLEGTEYYGNVDPLTSLTIHLPAGIDISSAGFPTCSEETIRDAGNWREACPTGSIAGLDGAFTAIVPFGSSSYEEQGGIQAVFGPGGVLYFVIDGDSPLSIELITEGHIVSDKSPYGQALELEVPLIQTTPSGPYGSFTFLTLNLGATREEDGKEIHSVTMPQTCPSGMFAWAADASFNNEASVPVAATETACPASGSRLATTTALHVSNTMPLINEVVTYTATVTPTSPQSPEPSGVVTFFDETIPIAGCESQPLTQGTTSSTATCQVSYPTYDGVHGISATYKGDTNYLGSSSLTETVTLSSGTEEILRKHREEEIAKKKGEEVPPSSTGTSSNSDQGGGSSASGAVGTISSAQLAASLGQQLIPSGKAVTIANLLKDDGLTMSFKAPEAGTLVVGWYEVPAGAKLAKHGKAKPALVASGQMTFTGAGTGKLKVRLTTDGKRLLKDVRRLELTAKGMFTAGDGAAASTTKAFVLRA